MTASLNTQIHAALESGAILGWTHDRDGYYRLMWNTFHYNADQFRPSECAAMLRGLDFDIRSPLS